MSNNKQIYHTWDMWECYRNGFYKSETSLNKLDQIEVCKKLFSDLKIFEKFLKLVTTEWKHSCEHFLTASGQNVVAWLGQASCSYAYKISNDISRIGYNECSDEEKKRADKLAQKYYEKWYKKTFESGVKVSLWG